MGSQKKPARKNKKGKKNKSLRNKIINLTLVIIASGILFITLFVFLVFAGLFGRLPGEDELKRIKNYTSTRVLSSDGKLLGVYYIENRTNEQIEDIPNSFIDALIATEDARFYEHKGIDTRSVFRVLIRSILLGDRDAGGGSTISQQLAKNLYPRKNYGPFTLPVAKTKEIIIARRLERVYNKEEILELYLNTVSFGENTYGVGIASMTFFNKPSSQLKPEESAMLVGLLKASHSYNPRNNATAAMSRRNVVLSQMAKYGHLTDKEADSLAALPIDLHYKKLDHIEGPAPYFREFIRLQAEDLLEQINEVNGTDYNLYTDGLTITTTLDLRLQQYAEEAVKKHMKDLQELFDRHWSGMQPWLKDRSLARQQITQSKPYLWLKNKGVDEPEIFDSLSSIKREIQIYTPQGYKDVTMSPLDSVLYHLGILQTGVLSMDPFSGDVRAWVGGVDFRYFKYDHVTASRQVGSTFKPIVYATAVEQGLDPCKFIENDSVTYKDFGDWTPANADLKYGGYYSVKGALIHSVNTVSVKVLMETGIDSVLKMTGRMGIESGLPEVPSLALGTGEMPLIELLPAYCSFVNGGMRIEPRYISKIEDGDGNLIYESPEQEGVRIMARSTAETMTAILEEATYNGTSRSLRTRYGLHGDLAGKTGTTQGQSDGWFIGYSPELVTGIWVGGEIPAVRFRTISLGSGSAMALPIFAYFADQASKNPHTRNSFSGSFEITREIRESLSCENFKEEIGFDLFDIFRKKKPEDDRKPEREVKEVRKQKDEPTKIGKFLRKIFGGKKDDKKKR